MKYFLILLSLFIIGCSNGTERKDVEKRMKYFNNLDVGDSLNVYDFEYNADETGLVVSAVCVSEMYRDENYIKYRVVFRCGDLKDRVFWYHIVVNRSNRILSKTLVR